MPKDTRPDRGPNSDRRESSDTYSDELYREGQWRIILSREGNQWILQRMTRATSPAGPRWVSEHWCQTGTALARVWPGSERAGLMFVACLPEHILTWLRWTGRVD